MNLRKVLITGAAGYQAGFLIARLRDHYDLTLTDIVPPKAEYGDLPFMQGDITQYADVERACAGQDAVVHTVALVRERFDKPAWLFADVMVKGTWNVAEACVKQGVQRLVNFSSVIAVGWPDTAERAYQVGDPSHFRANDLFYCLAKDLGERIGNAYRQAHGLSVIHIRPGAIANDGLNREPKPPEDGSPHWFLHVDPRDVAQAVELSLQPDAPDGCYQIVAGRSDTLFDRTEAAEKLGYRPEWNWTQIEERV